ncbi:MAG: hypothetical protein CL828_01220 [Crocinitomicaceae bacterium]|nr:hypothetical protein [Crocinitomicaceae bacterium]
MGLSYRLLGVIHALLIYFFVGLSSAFSQGTSFFIEEYMVHDGVQGVAELAGQTTYRYYLQLSHPEDFVSAIYGGDESPLELNLEEPMFNSVFATGSTAGGIIPLVANYFPEVAYDSWVTIGLESVPNGGGEVDVSSLQSETQPFLQSFVAGSSSDGEGFVVDDELGGAWFLLTGATNGYAGEDLKVLVMQITTAGVPSGVLNAQVISATENSDAVQVQQGFEGTEVWDLLPPAVLSGCTDPLACNYDETATEDDGSCEYDCGGCTDVWACNYNPNASYDDGSCDFFACIGCTEPSACNYDPEAVYNDGSCEYESCESLGCTSSEACNYDPLATVSDGSCEFTSCAGCTDSNADNYDPTATIDDGNCVFLGCLNPLACNYDPQANETDGTCDYESCTGCMDATACNFDPSYTLSDPASCVFSEEGYTCDGTCINDSDADGVCDEFEIGGCTDETAENFNESATDDDGSCTFSISGCINPLACNFNPNATSSDGSCDFLSCVGCTIEAACNYDPVYTIADDASCSFAEQYYSCSGECFGDNDGDGVCNELEIIGCTDALALNYDVSATDQDGSCTYPAVCNDEFACNFTPYEAYCIEIEAYAEHEGMVGTTDLSGYTTYRIYALCENEDDFVSAVAGDDEFSSFIHTTTSFFQHEAGGVLGESSNPLVFPFIPEVAYDSWVTIGLEGAAESANGESGVSILEGLNPWVEPFEEGGSLNISDALGGLWYILNGASNGIAGEDKKVLLGQFTTDGNMDGQLYVQFFENGDGINSGFNKLIGLQDACGLPTIDSCEYAEEHYDCDGNCLEDADTDGVCDALEILGCTDVEANNYDFMATDDDGSCDYYVDPCVQDTVAPYFIFVPADSTVQCDQAMPTVMAIAEDECDESVQVMFIDGPIEFIFDCPPYNYLCTRTFYASDDVGNTAQAIQVITVADTLAPVFLNQPEELIEVNEQAGEEIPEPFVAIQDACDGNAQWISSDVLIQLAGDTATYMRSYTATDACGNAANFDQTIVVLVATDGCVDALACNYNSEATNDDGSCIYPEDYVDCSGACLNDADGDGVCDELEIEGCTAVNACNYSFLATDDDASCDFCSCANDEIIAYGLQIDTVAVHEEGDLAGMTTYRLYVTTVGPDDFVSAVYGNDVDTLTLASDSSWYQHPFGSHLGQNIDSAFYDTFPELEYDSWVTIGVDGPTMLGENLVNAVGASGAEGWIAQFESGETLSMDDVVGGSWFILNGGSNGIAGDELRVLVAQVTTSGVPNGQLNVQVFEGGDNENASVHTFAFEGTTWTNAPVFQNACGCMDAEAYNYDDGAEYDDGSCVAIALGCTDASACNFDFLANTDNGNCSYPEIFYDCDGNCLNDVDGDGVCDELEIAGCTDETALNFNVEATDDNGSCLYCTLSVTAAVTDVGCAEASDGVISVAVEGAMPDSSEFVYTLLPLNIEQTDSVFTDLSGGVYDVVVVDEMGCVDTISVEINEPDPLIVLLDEVVGSAENAEEGSISITVSGGTEPYVYAWAGMNGSFTSTLEDIDDLNPGIYQVAVTDANGCNAQSFEIVVETIVGVAEFNQGWKLRVYPNPAADWVTVELPEMNEALMLELFDGTGRLLWQETATAARQLLRIPVGHCAIGHYIIRVSNGTSVKQEKLYVNR